MTEQVEGNHDPSSRHRFDIKSIRENEDKPFNFFPARSFLKEWFAINDSISPAFLDRHDWEIQTANSGILEKMTQGGHRLFLPYDLRLDEMVGVFEAIDNDTFAAQPERKSQSSEKIIELMSFLRDVSIYFYSRLDKIQSTNQKFYASQINDQDTNPKGEQRQENAISKASVTREIAHALSEELYEYGTKFDKGVTPLLAEVNLSPERTMCMDIYVTTGEILSDTEAAEFLSFLSNPSSLEDEKRAQRYRAIRMRLPQRNVLLYAAKKGVFDSEDTDAIEDYRSEKIAQFFRVYKQAFELNKRGENGELLSPQNQMIPWQNSSPVYKEFLTKVETAIGQAIMAPKNELMSAIFRRGLKKLVDEIRVPRNKLWKQAVSTFFEDYLKIDLHSKEKKLADELHISQLRDELESIRQLGDKTRISAKEREITDKIQKAVSNFPYELSGHSPTDIITLQSINCVGASMLGSELMKQAGLHHLTADIPTHSFLFLITTDGHVELRDMLNKKSNDDLTDYMIKGTNKNGTQITVNNIVDFSHNPHPSGLLFKIIYSKNPKTLLDIKEGKLKYVTVFGAEHGLQLQVLNNIAINLKTSNSHSEALEAFYQIIAFNPQFVDAYLNIGAILSKLGRHEGAIEVLRQAIKVNPTYTDSYYELGDKLYMLKRNDEAIAVYKKFLKLTDPVTDKEDRDIAKSRLMLLQQDQLDLK